MEEKQVNGKIMISCKEATYLCCKRRETSLTVYEKLRLMLHSVICKSCATFSKHNTFLSNPKNFDSFCSELKMSPSKKEEIKRKLSEK